MTEVYIFTIRLNDSEANIYTTECTTECTK